MIEMAETKAAINFLVTLHVCVWVGINITRILYVTSIVTTLYGCVDWNGRKKAKQKLPIVTLYVCVWIGMDVVTINAFY